MLKAQYKVMALSNGIMILRQIALNPLLRMNVA